MKLNEYVETLLLGFNTSVKSNTLSSKEYEYKQLTISSINSCFINHNELKTIASGNRIDDKFFTKIGDIIICCKQPYNVIYIDEEKDENILVPSNFIILRDIKTNKTFLYNFLVCFRSTLLSNKKEDGGNDNITKTEVEDFEIPVLSNETIEKLSKVAKRINKRQSLYSSLIDNDKELITSLYRKEGVIEND